MTSAIQSVLHPVQVEAGGEFMEDAGWTWFTTFGDANAEYEAIRRFYVLLTAQRGLAVLKDNEQRSREQDGPEHPVRPEQAEDTSPGTPSRVGIGARPSPAGARPLSRDGRYGGRR